MNPMTIGLIGGTGLGMLKAGQNQKKEAAQTEYRKAAIRYSPWTHMGDPGALGLETDPLAAGLGGASRGAAIGSMFGGAGAAAPAAGAMPQVGGMNALAAGDQQAPAQTGAAPMGSPGAYQGNRYSLFQDPNAMQFQQQSY